MSLLPDVLFLRLLELSADGSDCSFDVTFELVVSLKSALMTFSLEVNGVSMGSVEAKFN